VRDGSALTVSGVSARLQVAPAAGLRRIASTVFRRRSEEQTIWLAKACRARPMPLAAPAGWFVVTEAGSIDVVAYYPGAWPASSRSSAAASKGAGRYPQPVALLLAWGLTFTNEGRGLGPPLLADGDRPHGTIGSEVGCRGLPSSREHIGAEHSNLQSHPGIRVSPHRPHCTCAADEGHPGGRWVSSHGMPASFSHEEGHLSFEAHHRRRNVLHPQHQVHGSWGRARIPG